MKQKCAVTSGLVDLSKYEKLDKNWKDLKLAAPARRALVDKKILRINDLRKITEKQLKELHGMGPTALKLLKKEFIPEVEKEFKRVIK